MRPNNLPHINTEAEYSFPNFTVSKRKIAINFLFFFLIFTQPGNTKKNMICFLVKFTHFIDEDTELDKGQ